jgi:glycosyltransferase involved in cell wall biosynthesis
VGDDGSEDNTVELIAGYQNEGKIKIRYFRQKNSGKHIAVNEGVRIAAGNLFLILDSDDELTADAVETVQQQWHKLLSDYNGNIHQFGGIVADKMYADGKLIGTTINHDETLDATIIDYRFRRKITGDKLEIFRTEILKQYPFPEHGEKFCPEALVWNRIGSVYKFRFFNKAIYKAEYLPNGLTSRITKIRISNPINASTYYAELSHYDIPVLQKIKAVINYWRFCIYDTSVSAGTKFGRTNAVLNVFCIVPGLLLAWNDKA